MLNIYNGIALPDASGEATVELPGWFEALNDDHSYGNHFKLPVARLA